MTKAPGHESTNTDKHGEAAGMRPVPASFASQYRHHAKPVFAELAARELEDRRDAGARAREYAERGKPDFALAFLLIADLPDDEKRSLYALAFERRADHSEQTADELDRRFHRPFPLVQLEAVKDRTTAARIRAGDSLRPGLGRPLPTL